MQCSSTQPTVSSAPCVSLLTWTLHLSREVMFFLCLSHFSFIQALSWLLNITDSIQSVISSIQYLSHWSCPPLSSLLSCSILFWHLLSEWLAWEAEYGSSCHQLACGYFSARPHCWCCPLVPAGVMQALALVIGYVHCWGLHSGKPGGTDPSFLLGWQILSEFCWYRGFQGHLALRWQSCLLLSGIKESTSSGKSLLLCPLPHHLPFPPFPPSLPYPILSSFFFYLPTLYSSSCFCLLFFLLFPPLPSLSLLSLI